MVDQVWPQLAEGFHRAVMVTGGDWTAGDLWVAARSGNGFLFVSFDGTAVHGASIWRFETWQTGAKFRCLALYGENMAAWYPEMRELVKQTAGAAKVVYEGRKGWERAEPDARPVRTLYEER